jgi:hypothetical protein
MVTVTPDPALGGRWTSLHAAGRDWLWHSPDPARSGVRPGDSFVDVGGVEECLPNVRGVPDHGDAWSRPWTVLDPDTAAVEGDGYRLQRRFGRSRGELTVDYRLEADPGWTFVWAAHALLHLSPAAVLHAPVGTSVRLDDGVRETWPCGLEKLGPDDGTAIGAILIDCPRVTVDDGERLTFSLEAPGQPVSTALWRNLRGWPAGAPYRSIGVEPMLGRSWDRTGDPATVGDSGLCEWRLTVEET